MGNLGGGEILVILIIGLIVLGPTRLPEASKNLGNALRQIRQTSRNFQAELEAAVEDPLIEETARQKGREMLAEEKDLKGQDGEKRVSEPSTIDENLTEDESQDP
ncbi:MAG: twin-arginine translocase subunit TatB [Actinobacteria bacterium]|nr:twin-arginine translocase subunit TatB [Actinomycetota bacterium]|tara:strand:+ start:1240 stop:1554 length:315 start_codon:yes stop_codon:yes gene_type:complete